MPFDPITAGFIVGSAVIGGLAEQKYARLESQYLGKSIAGLQESIPLLEKQFDVLEGITEDEYGDSISKLSSAFKGDIKELSQTLDFATSGGTGGLSDSRASLKRENAFGRVQEGYGFGVQGLGTGLQKRMFELSSNRAKSLADINSRIEEAKWRKKVADEKASSFLGLF